MLWRRISPERITIGATADTLVTQLMLSFWQKKNEHIFRFI
jgi:hypothetical protein